MIISIVYQTEQNMIILLYTLYTADARNMQLRYHNTHFFFLCSQRELLKYWWKLYLILIHLVNLYWHEVFHKCKHFFLLKLLVFPTSNFDYIRHKRYNNLTNKAKTITNLCSKSVLCKTSVTVFCEILKLFYSLQSIGIYC